MNEWLERCKLERCRTDSILSLCLERTIGLEFRSFVLECRSFQLEFRSFVLVQQIVSKNQLELIGKRVQKFVLKSQLELIGKRVQQLVLKNQLELIGKRVPLRGKKNQSPMERIGELVQLNVIPTGHWLLMQALEMLQRWLG